MTQETNNLVKSLSSPSSATKSKQIIKTDNNKGTDGEKRKSRSHRVQHKPEFMTRIVIRQLPPTMNEEQFLEVVSPLPAHTEFYYVNGDVNLAEFAFSRAYIKFTNIDDMLIFNQKYDDYIFLDSKGNEYPAIVEYAPMQKLPRRLNSMNIKKDSKANTIDNDPDFIAFKEALETIQNDGTAAAQQQQPQTITTAEQLLEEIEKNKESKENINQIPPLVEYLNKKRLEKLKIQEEKKRKKDELKKKKKEEIRVKKLEKKKEKQMEQKKSKQTTEKSSTKDRIDNKQQIDRKTVIIVSGGSGSGVGGDRRKRQEKQQQPSPLPQSQVASSSSNSNIGKDSKKSSSNEMDENSKSNVKIMNKNDDNQQTPTKNHKEKEKSNSNRRDDRQRIRNKDRPTLEIYRPGMGRHQQQQQSIQKSSNSSSSSSSNHQQQQQQMGNGDDDNKPKDSVTQSSSSSSSSTTIPSKQPGTTNQNYSDKPKYKYRVFTRTRTNKPNN